MGAADDADGIGGAVVRLLFGILDSTWPEINP